MTTITFRVYDTPRPGGSKRAFVIQPKGGGRPRAVVTDDCKGNKTWREAVKAAALEYYKGAILTGPVSVFASFVMPRPKGHYRTGANANLLRDSAPAFPAGKPDALKLMRSTEDALTGIIWRDDAQVVVMGIEKIYETQNAKPGAMITVETL